MKEIILDRKTTKSMSTLYLILVKWEFNYSHTSRKNKLDLIDGMNKGI